MAYVLVFKCFKRKFMFQRIDFQRKNFDLNHFKFTSAVAFGFPIEITFTGYQFSDFSVLYSNQTTE